VILFPNSKINLGLNIVRRRNDAFHDIETVFYPINFTDALEIISSENKFQFTLSGLQFNNSKANNLCIKALELIKKDFPQIGPVKIHLHKAIPVGAGLGGGSSDAAFTLKLLNQKFDLQISNEKLLRYALQLGSDCPFFIISKPAFASGRGETLESLQLDLSNYNLVMVNPQIHISTAWAFTHTIPTRPIKPIKEIIQQPIETWKKDLKNDFEETVFKQYPAIKNIKDELYKTGAVYSSMTGSGSTVYAIFNKEQEPGFNFPSNYFIKKLTC
jgi:4-diphosphocytidyl-2-C-methyl-D-erythritol kinase